MRAYRDPDLGHVFIVEAPHYGYLGPYCTSNSVYGYYPPGSVIDLFAVPRNCGQFLRWEDDQDETIGVEADLALNVDDVPGQPPLEVEAVFCNQAAAPAVNLRIDSNNNLELGASDDEVEETSPFVFWVNNDSDAGGGRLRRRRGLRPTPPSTPSKTWRTSRSSPSACPAAGRACLRAP